MLSTCVVRVTSSKLLQSSNCQTFPLHPQEEGQTPLQRVCLLDEKPSEKHVKVIKLLTERGANLMFEDEVSEEHTLSLLISKVGRSEIFKAEFFDK